MSAAILIASMVLLPSELEPWYGQLSDGSWANAADEAFVQVSADSTSAAAAAALTISLILDQSESTDQFTAFSSSPFDSLSYLSWAASGFLTLEQGSLSQAERALTNSVELNSESPLTWYFMGILREIQQDTISALTCYERCYSLDPGFLPGGINLSRLMTRSGRSTEALGILESIMSSGSPAGRLALAEFILLQQPMDQDSLEEQMLQNEPRSWIILARDLLENDPHRALEATQRGLSDTEGDLQTELSEILLELGEIDLAVSVSREALITTTDSVFTLRVLGEALFESGDYSGSRDVFQSILDVNPFSLISLNYLGRISEQYAETERAVNYYLMALELDPFDICARERLRIIAADSYDPYKLAESLRGFSAQASVDLSIEQGNRPLLEYGGSARASYVFDSLGTSVEAQLGGRTVSWEEDYGIKRDTLSVETGWALAVFNYWLSDQYFLEASSHWDRQVHTVRPWQVDSHIAAGCQRYVSDWVWFSPELGIGLVNSKWDHADGATYMDNVTVYASAGLWYSKPYTFVRDAQLSGSIHFPPDDPDQFISTGYMSLSLRTWSPLFISLRYSVDYTRRPEVSTWEKFNTSFSLSLNFDLI